MPISNTDRDKLYRQLKHSLGAPIRQIELTDEQLCTLLEIATENYSEIVQAWLIENQWQSLLGASISSTDMAFALSTRTLDLAHQASYAYSKQVGLQANGPWELKKDYVSLEAGRQVYQIPAGREINEVLWVTPPNIPNGGFSPASTGAWIPGAQGWFVGGYGMQAALPSYSLMLFGQDRQQKKKLLQSELTYRVTAGADGTKNLYLYPIPGSIDEMSGQFGKHYDGAKVFYFYYETNSRGRKKCLEQNNDIIKTPNDVPLGTLGWNQLNDVSKVRVRRLLVSKLKRFLAINRGKFSGEILGPNGKTLKLDYEFLEEQAKNEEERLYEEIKESLINLSYDKMMETRANIAENLARVLAHQPSRVQFVWG